MEYALIGLFLYLTEQAIISPIHEKLVSILKNRGLNAMTLEEVRSIYAPGVPTMFFHIFGAVVWAAIWLITLPLSFYGVCETAINVFESRKK